MTADESPAVALRETLATLLGGFRAIRFDQAVVSTRMWLLEQADAILAEFEAHAADVAAAARAEVVDREKVAEALWFGSNYASLVAPEPFEFLPDHSKSFYRNYADRFIDALGGRSGEPHERRRRDAR